MEDSSRFSSRNIVRDINTALSELDTALTKPPWMEGDIQLPFSHLKPDEFEILCFLLLKNENPDVDVFYYGKTGDAGRDIVVRHKEVTSFYQCKHYSDTVGITSIRAEITKLFCNVYNKVLSEVSQEIVFLVSTDFSAPAQDLLDSQLKWLNIAEDELTEYLGGKPDTELLRFSKTWWPKILRSNGVEISHRVRKFPDLVDQFFSFTKVVDINAIKPQMKLMNDKLDLILDTSNTSGPQKTVALLRSMEQANQGLSFSTTINAAGEIVYAVSPQKGASVKVGKLSFPPGPKGDIGKEKIQKAIDFGYPASFEEGEFEWISYLNEMSAKEEVIYTHLDVRPNLHKEPFEVEIVSGEGDKSQTVIRYAHAQMIRIGRKEMEFKIWGGYLAGTLNMIFSFTGEPAKITSKFNLSSVPLRIAKSTIELTLRMAMQSKISIVSIDLAAPLIIFEAELDLQEKGIDVWQNALSTCSKLEFLASKFNLDLRYPEHANQEWIRELELAWGAVKYGQVAELVPGNVQIQSIPISEAERMLAIWEHECPVNLKDKNTQPVKIGNVVLPLGERFLVLENASPTDGIEALRQQIKSTAEHMLTINVATNRIIHEFPKYKLRINKL